MGPGLPARPRRGPRQRRRHARLLWGTDCFAWSRSALRQLGARPGAEPLEDPHAALARPMLDRYGFALDEELIVGQWTVDPMPSRLRQPLDVRFVPVRWATFTGPPQSRGGCWSRPDGHGLSCRQP
ncbi:hypothetical protein QNO07_14285 [Streptomyces sp. 549]|uniref:hypothetical protein n=1 Tax=Streptomyces sp. 549 TaxID=3049076 RepID=UPI0024C432FC|nr:hypothetical protein [Streptomyces sp. 549]MDK1474574.1 hypothetical protein [Streptomyces sp. 549]